MKEFCLKMLLYFKIFGNTNNKVIVEQKNLFD